MKNREYKRILRQAQDKFSESKLMSEWGASKRMKKIDKVLKILVVLTFFIFLGYLTIFPIEDADIWFHLKAGEHIVQNQKLPSPDPFSYPIPNLSYPDWEYGAQLAYYLAFKMAGLNGVILFKSFLILVTFGAVLWLVSRLIGNSILTIGLIGLAAVASADRFMVRMEHVSNLFFAVLLVILYQYREFKRMKSESKRMSEWRWLLLLPLLFLIWVNTHSTAVFGLGIFGLFVTGETLTLILANVKRMRTNERIKIDEGLGEVRVLWVVFGLSFLATLINPFFLRAHLHPFEFAGSIYGQRIYEWMSPFSFYWRDTPYVFYFKVVAVVYGTVMLFGLFNFDLTNYLLFFAFAYLGFTQVRHTAFFALFGLVPVLATISPLLDKIRPPALLRALSKFVLIGIFIFLIIHFSNNGYVLGRSRRYFGLGVKPIFPDGVLAFLDENGISGNMFNQYGMGGYLIFAAPERPVFMDGRNHYPEEFYREYLAVADSAEKLEEVAQKYDINYFIMTYPEPQLGLNQPQYYLTDSDDWILVYWDNYYLVYLKKREENYPAVEEHNFFYADPVKLSKLDYLQWFSGPGEAANLARIRTVGELERNLEAVPNNARAHILLGGIYEMIPSPSTAEEEYRKAVELEPDSAQAHTLLGGVLLKQGKLEEAKKELLLAIKYDPLLAEAYMNLGLIFQQQKRGDKAEKYYQKVLNVNPRFANAYLALGYLYLGENKTEEAKQTFAAYLELQPEGEEAERVRQILFDLSRM